MRKLIQVPIERLLFAIGSSGNNYPEIAMKNISVADYLFCRLGELGLRHIFILPGGGCMYLIDALTRQEKIKAIPLLHEQAVGIAAEAYSQYAGNLGVALVTTGPGGTNAITACAAAWTDSTPMLFISGQVKTSDIGSTLGLRQLGFQELPITDVVKPITKKAICLERANDIAIVFEELIDLTKSGRPGPVWLDIPLDIQNQTFSIPETQLHIQTDPPPTDLTIEVTKLISSLMESEKPLFLLGNGIRLSGTLASVEESLRIVGVPALLTWKMIDFFDEEDSLNAGRPGAIAQPWSNILQEEADLLISLGARIDTGQSSYNLTGFAQNAVKYVIDIDGAELRKFPSNSNYKPLHFDLKHFIPELLRQLHFSNFSPEKPSLSKWRERLIELKREYRRHLIAKSSEGNQVNLYRFITALSSVVKRDAVLVPGSSGACSEVMMQCFQVKRGQRVFNSEGLGPMGFGIPAALGACIAGDKRQVICIDGDGGFLMNIQELASVKLHADNIIFFVLNNNGYGSIKLTHDKLFSGRRLGTDPSTGLALVSTRAVASAFGFEYEALKDEASIEKEIERILTNEASVIVEVFVDPNQITLPRVKTMRDNLGNPLPSDMKVMDF
jgi:acetolactate synthase-1/2/3 large subunit